MHDLLPHLRTELKILPEPGQLNVLTGENGIGKSTYLRHLFLVFEEKYRVVFSEQKPLDVFFDRTLKDFRVIILSASPVINQKFFEYFWKASGLAAKENRSLSHLSGGESQLLKLISVCSADGEIYLLDEPGQYLDREKKKLLRELVTELKKQNKTVVIVEHDCSWLPEGTNIRELHVENEILKEKSAWTI